MKYSEGFVTYDIAKKLESLGFKEDCYNQFVRGGSKVLNSTDYEDVIKAPLIQQAVGWLREEYGINVEATSIWNQTVTPHKMYYIPTVNTNNREYEAPFDVDDIDEDYYKTIIKAIEEGIKQIKI